MWVQFVICLFAFFSVACEPRTPVVEDDIRWQHLSSTTGDLPVPNGGKQQTSSLVVDLDQDGLNDFVITERTQAPSVVWFRRIANGWSKYIIENTKLTPEAGGAFCDIDGDGDLDVIFGGDWQSDEIWWWENPNPNFDPNRPWKRHIIKNSGKTQHHDQLVDNFLDEGTPQIVSWNQGAGELLLFRIPSDPKHTSPWSSITVADGIRTGEGLGVGDIDGDGKVDIVGAGRWYKHLGGTNFATYVIDTAMTRGRVAVGDLVKNGNPEIVMVVGDGVSRLKWYECTGDPRRTDSWVKHDLLGIDVNHGHSLQIADINGDGNLDIFCAEMGKWTENAKEPNNAQAKAWIFYGDGKGHFRKTVLSNGYGFHEGRIADLDGDGDLDVLDKPYNWETPRVDVWLNNGTGSQKVAHDNIFNGSPGLELYSLRHELSRDVADTLDRVKSMGFKEVELPGFYGLTPIEFRRQLDELEIKCTSVIFPYDQFRDHLADVIENTKIMGAKYVVCAWIPHSGKLTLANVEKTAGEFNSWGKELKTHGLHFCYHTHGYEFLSVDNETLFDKLVQRTRPEWVNYEMDIFWIVRSGQDPMKLLQKYPRRFPLMHLKDMRKGTPIGILSGKAPKDADVPLGEGKIDIPAILREAEKIGVKHYYIEDESSQAVSNISISLRYLRDIRF